MTSFSSQKRLRFIITLGTGTFGSGGDNQITLEGFRSVVDIDKAGGMMMGTLRAKIYGVSQQNMNSITTLQWKPKTWLENTVEVYAIDGDQETLIFAGNIVNAWGDYQSAPDVYLHIQAQSAFYNALKTMPPKSFDGDIDVATIFEQIANDMELTFENNGVGIKLTDVYLSNTGLEQAKELAKMARCDLYIDGKVLAITPENAPRDSLIPILSRTTGMIGYPTFDGIGITVKSLFNPSITFGGLIKVDSSIEQANGEWIVVSMGMRLESEKPDGAWFTTIRGNQNGLAVRRR